ncbi:hypothetical protein GQ44DRAFT_623606 [Phaeosphaeriaceae sp. PMI808]|nr:hypothetical protein GQ44DRAFT_623606 [Phaeosphaeriaceae sp. PMI808]
MADVQSRPAAELEPDCEPQSKDKDALIARLDNLLEHYLNTLDQYQKAQDYLSKQLSSSYLALAQANFQNRSPTHYGQDYYDERMQAIRKVTIQRDESGSTDDDHVKFAIATTSTKDTSTKQPDDISDQASDTPEPSATLEESKETASEQKPPTDPLHWFGILVPSALRTAQSSFISVVEEAIPQLMTVTKDLRQQEMEIGRVRKQLKKI